MQKSNKFGAKFSKKGFFKFASKRCVWFLGWKKIVNDQVTRWFEVHKLLPENQHGFRAKRSTMKATASMQQEWVYNTDEKEITGILFWDLPAAYDTPSPELIFKKLEIYSLCKLTVGNPTRCARNKRSHQWGNS